MEDNEQYKNDNEQYKNDNYETGLYNSTYKSFGKMHIATSYDKCWCGIPIAKAGEIEEDNFIDVVTCKVCKEKWMILHEEDSKEW